MKYIRTFNEIGLNDVALVGGKTASLGELYSHLRAEGIRIPDGFAITADAFTLLLEHNRLGEKLARLLERLDADDMAQLDRCSAEARALLLGQPLPEPLRQEITAAYQALSRRAGSARLDVAVRSSATAEDLPGASFAGLHDSFLNVIGEEQLHEACSGCFASLFNARAISYRVRQGFQHGQVKLSIAVQQMVRADQGSAGVAFTLDTESGHRNVILITSSYGLGESIVAGKVDPDEFLVLKPTLEAGKQAILRRRVGAKQLRLIYSETKEGSTESIDVPDSERERLSLTDEDVLILARWALAIERYYSNFFQTPTPMDVEWALDGRHGDLFILQARPETVHARAASSRITSYHLDKTSRRLLSGRAIGSRIGAGPVWIATAESNLADFRQGEVLVADMTSPGWEPVMRKAAAIITNRGGRTCHAAIISRELGVPCIVGTGAATSFLQQGQNVTVDCSEGEVGIVLEDLLPFHTEEIVLDPSANPRTATMINVGNPAEALKTSLLPSSGVGLARLEFIISEHVRIHPLALIQPERVLDAETRQVIAALTRGHSPAEHYFVDKLVEGISIIAGAFYPRPVIVRFSDFKTNEYASLIGGRYFEPVEENPMLGWRGSSRYYSELYRAGFALECRALKKAREEMGLENVKAMIPFCRTPKEAELVLAEMAKNGLQRGAQGLEVYMMCEIPSNVILVESFAQHFDGFSIGSNDLTQLTLGIDRDSQTVAHLFDERDPAVMRLLEQVIHGAKAAGIKIGICGQAPSDYPEMTEFLVNRGIDSISFSPDALVTGLAQVLSAEAGTSR